MSRTDTVFLAVTQRNIPEDLQSAATPLRQPQISQMLTLVWRITCENWFMFDIYSCVAQVLTYLLHGAESFLRS